MKKGSISAGLPDAARAEQFETLATLAADGATVERIVSDGQSSPPGFWYDQDWDEWVLIVNGGATLRFESPPASETGTGSLSPPVSSVRLRRGDAAASFPSKFARRSYTPKRWHTRRPSRSPRALCSADSARRTDDGNGFSPARRPRAPCGNGIP